MFGELFVVVKRGRVGASGGRGGVTGLSASRVGSRSTGVVLLVDGVLWIGGSVLIASA